MDQNQPSSDGDRWEPDEVRVSSPVLRGRGGEIPPRYSPDGFFVWASGSKTVRQAHRRRIDKLTAADDLFRSMKHAGGIHETE